MSSSKRIVRKRLAKNIKTSLKILIVCEGLTESTYIEDLLGDISNVEIVSIDGAGYGKFKNYIESNEKFSMICYLAMGWCIIFKFNLLPEAIGYNGIWLLVAGGVAYTIGTVFYGLQNKYRYMHSIWHLWILLGSVLHFLCIILYVI